jgi:alpha,alpha-trehalose phosphorylase
VLKQADVVLAMYLRGEHFDVEEKRRNFDYYDPITTGDSSLSACVQSIVAAEVGYEDLALDYFHQSLYLDLADTHDNTADGAHIANAGGVWAGLVYGFGGLVDTGDHLEFQPRIPGTWTSLKFALRRHGSSMRINIDHENATIAVVDGRPVPVRMTDGTIVSVEAGRVERLR